MVPGIIWHGPRHNLSAEGAGPCRGPCRGRAVAVLADLRESSHMLKVLNAFLWVLNPFQLVFKISPKM